MSSLSEIRNTAKEAISTQPTSFLPPSEPDSESDSLSPPPPQSGEWETTALPESNMIVVGVLIGLICILLIILAWVTIPPIVQMIRRKIPVSQKRIDRRYATIEGWIITKVCCAYLNLYSVQ
jgi:hypothetical protein